MSFVNPDFLFLLLFLPVLFWIYRKSLVEKKPYFTVISFFLSLLALVCLIVALARPFIKEKNDAVHLNIIVDVSKSIEHSDMMQKIVDIKELIKNLGRNDSYQLFVFGDNLKRISYENFEKAIEEYFSVSNKSESFSAETNLENAVKSARMFYPSGKIKKLILFSDGRQTSGSFENTKEFFEKDNILVQTIRLKTKEKDEVFVYQFSPSSETAYEGERVRLKATLSMNYTGPIKAKFIYDGIVDKEYEVPMKANQKYDLYHDVIVKKSGVNLWKVEVSAPKDYFLINNELSCFVDVKGKPRVLAIHQKEAKLRQFKKAVEAQNINIDVRGKFGVPDSLSKLLEYDAIILADLPATLMTERQMNYIKKYVTEYGGGLIMTGSENSFGLGGYYRTPVEEVLPIISRYEKEKEKPSLALMLVIDKSGSMEGVPIQLAKQAAKSAIDLLGNNDFGGVVAFDSQAFIVSELLSMYSKNSVLDSIDIISAGGGTDMLPGMTKGKEMLDGSSAKIKHMIVLGDGQTNPEGLVELAGEMSMSKITVSVVALGDGADRLLFKAIADRGNGRYYETNDPSTVPQIFTKETVEASKSAIKESPFVPIKVGRHEMLEGINFESAPYLIGYVMTKIKPTAQMQLLTEEGDPLLAIGQYGLGKGIAFTSDVTEQWAFEWLDWNDFGKFWGQVIRSCLRRENKDGIRIVKEESQNQLHLNITQNDERGVLQPNQNWTGIVSGQNGLSEKVNVVPMGYGVYQTKFLVEEQGLYSLKLINNEEGKSITTHFQKNYPKEYQLGSPVSTYFEKLIQNPISNTSSFAHSYQDVSSFFILLALSLVILAIVFRRI